MERKLEEMDHRIGLLLKEGTPVGQQSFSSKPPFTKEVIDTSAPRRFKMPQPPQYDGTTDPIDHLETFKTLMLLHGASDGFLCKALPTNWSRSEGQVPNLDPSAAINALLMGVRFADFRLSIAKKTPSILADLIARAEKYITAEETLAALNLNLSGQNDEKRKVRDEDKNGLGSALKLRHDKREPRRERSPLRREEEYAPLNTRREQILIAIQGEKFLTWPQNLWTPGDKRNKSKYCWFHKDHGHDTDECRHLKEEIENLI
ncbi:uncharacterized protein LOC143888478 [Tasmannia lanceolata]|uniref:uncharacterized protein LOC143888478 n=1 Tax=Tasmannia lanceolata TaxID=3420 RepID=UPI004063FFBA